MGFLQTSSSALARKTTGHTCGSWKHFFYPNDHSVLHRTRVRRETLLPRTDWLWLSTNRYQKWFDGVCVRSDSRRTLWQSERSDFFYGYQPRTTEHSAPMGGMDQLRSKFIPLSAIPRWECRQCHHRR